MRRREFVAIAAGAAASVPQMSLAQQRPSTMPRLGALLPGRVSAPISVSVRSAFERGLWEQDYVEGRNISIEYTYSADPNEFARAAKEVVDLGVDVILASGSAGTIAAKRATSSIPIVGAVMADPVADGLVVSLSRPSGNVTGNTLLGAELTAKRLQLLQELVPGLTRIAALQHRGIYGERTDANIRNEMLESAKTLGLECEVFNAQVPGEFAAAFDGMVKARAEGLIVLSSPMFYVNHRQLVELAASHRLPTMYVFKEAVQAGGLICYGPDIPDLWRRAAGYVVGILKGAKPADLPVEQPTKFEFLVNATTARALGLIVPPSLLARVDEVIE
jgi:putative ABC transport system substrate-binding protein